MENQKVTILAIFLAAVFGLCTCQEPGRPATVGNYQVEITFDSVLHYLSDTSTSSGMVCLFTTCRNLTGDTVRLKLKARSGELPALTARYKHMTVPLTVCARKGILELLPHQTVLQEELSDGYEFKVRMGAVSHSGDDESAPFVYSEKFYDDFFTNCTFHLEDTSLRVRLFKHPKFKIVNGQRTIQIHMHCDWCAIRGGGQHLYGRDRQPRHPCDSSAISAPLVESGSINQTSLCLI